MVRHSAALASGAREDQLFQRANALSARKRDVAPKRASAARPDAARKARHDAASFVIRCSCPRPYQPLACASNKKEPERRATRSVAALGGMLMRMLFRLAL